MECHSCVHAYHGDGWCGTYGIGHSVWEAVRRYVAVVLLPNCFSVWVGGCGRAEQLLPHI